MLTIIGLSLDVVGAAVLAIGLFRPSQQLFPGWSRDPVEAASDYSSGLTGFAFLAAGFLLQGIGALIAGDPPSVSAGLLAAGLTVAVGAIAASIIFESLRAALPPGEGEGRLELPPPLPARSSLGSNPGMACAPALADDRGVAAPPLRPLGR